MATNKSGKPRKSKLRIKPFWERGYNGHVYWLGKQKLGKVTLLGRREASVNGRYCWEAAGKIGYSADLDKARSAVELAVAMVHKQMDLFP